MIQLQGAGKRFGHKLLFEDCDWLITPKERTGLVGGNGTGKSTLLKILCGLETLDYGNITFAKGITRGYLPQDGLSLKGRTVFAECMSVFADLREMEQEMESLHHKLAEMDPAGAEYAAASDRLHHIDSEFRNRDGYAIEAQVGTVLNGLGFRKEDWPRLTEEFSGRLADAPGAGQAAARETQYPAARRAHQSPRSGSSQLAGIVSGRLSQSPAF